MRIARALIMTVILFLFNQEAFSQIVLFGRKYKDENAELVKSNADLRHCVDSLTIELESCRKELDSLMSSFVPQNESFNEFELSDSLLHMWYACSRDAVHVKDFDMDVERFTSDVSDEEFMKRLADMNSFISIPFNSVIKNCCILYGEKMPSSMGKIMGLCEYYWPVFDEIFSHYGLPLELKALVVVESMMDPTATSRMGAKGLWQFMYRTARGYGLRIDSWVDERMDPVKSTIAAARYLRDAYSIYNDWPLAIASYNCGAGNVNKAIRRSGGKTDFWEIYDNLPRETRGYVPAFVGVLYASHYYRECGINAVRDTSLVVPVDTFMIRKNLHFNQISELLAVPQNTLKALNPQYLHEVVPGTADVPCCLRLPSEYTDGFIECGDSLYCYKQDIYLNKVELKKIEDSSPDGKGLIVYKVKSGDNLGYIARRYRVTVAQIKKWNSLRSTNIRIGQKLVIYK